MGNICLKIGEAETSFSDLHAATNAALDEMKNGKAVSLTLTGTHFLSSPVCLSGKDLPDTASLALIGKEDAALTSIVTLPGEGFEKLDDTNIYVYQLPESAKVNGEFPPFRDLYLDGKTLRICRNNEDATMFMDSCRRAPNNGLVTADRTLFLHKRFLENIELDQNGAVIGDLEFWIKTEWQVHCVHIESIKKPEVAFRDNQGEELWPVVLREYDWNTFIGSYYSRLNGYPYWLANNKAFLLSEGNFFYNQNAGLLYIYSETPLAGHTVAYPLCERLLFLTDFANLTVENIAFSGVTCNYITKEGYITGQGGRIKRVDPETGVPTGFLRLAAIYGENVRNIEIRNCFFHDVGNDGVNFRCAVDDVKIHHCRFENIGGSAIRIGQNTPEFSEAVHAKDINITYNYIDRTGQVFSSNTGILIASVLNLELSYNTILHSVYSAISVGWSWSAHIDDDPAEFDGDQFVNVKNANISHNYIAYYMMGMRDGGAIYTLGGNATKHYKPYLNSLNNNYIVTDKGIARGGSAWTVLYHDSGSSHWHDYDNLLVVHPEAPLPVCTYLSYQLHAPCYHCRSNDLYIIGYPKDHDDSDTLPVGYDDPTHEKRVGWMIATGHRTLSYEELATFHADINEKTGAYTVYSRTHTQYDRIVENTYLYRSFDDPLIDDATKAKLSSIAAASGTDGAHGVYGVYEP